MNISMYVHMYISVKRLIRRPNVGMHEYLDWQILHMYVHQLHMWLGWQILSLVVVRSSPIESEEGFGVFCPDKLCTRSVIK
jgi:hypothetical protein